MSKTRWRLFALLLPLVVVNHVGLGSVPGAAGDQKGLA